MGWDRPQGIAQHELRFFPRRDAQLLLRDPFDLRFVTERTLLRKAHHWLLLKARSTITNASLSLEKTSVDKYYFVI